MSVTADSMTRGFAPRRNVDTEITGASTSGYSRTERLMYPSTPKSTSATASMLVRTGLRMERSEIFIGGGLPWEQGLRPAKLPTHERAKRGQSQFAARVSQA